jgi:hypothetical protein
MFSRKLFVKTCGLSKDIYFVKTINHEGVAVRCYNDGRTCTLGCAACRLLPSTDPDDQPVFEVRCMLMSAPGYGGVSIGHLEDWPGKDE